MSKPYKNSGLFSDHYLSDILPRLPDWEVDSGKLNEAFSKIKTLHRNRKDELPELSEASLEERFIRPILRTHLHHFYEVQSGIPYTIEGTKKPDYAFFPDEQTRATALKAKTEEFFNTAIAVGEVKQWGRPLDKKLKTEKDLFEIQNPSLQISRYLWLTGTKWGVLTDGRFWRLYERETSKRIDIYYEVDLSTLLEQGTIDDFKYFYVFFNREAFTKDADGLCLLDQIYQESVEYREKVSDELKANIYQALRILAEGFLKNPANNLSADSLQEIHDNSLVFLYRLLFILYAEYRDLLPMDNSIYRDSYSLYALKREIAEKIDANAALSQTMSHYHGKLKELFEVINVGNKELGVPPYNGGLFDPNKHEFLEKYRVGDAYLAQVIDLLSRSSDKAFVDYSSLEIRHLGSIYEGLLEYRLRIADEDMVTIKEKGKETWVPATKARQGSKIFDEAKKGEVYLTTDKGERKATGSYYTPDYIVKYIVENTVGPLINEKKKFVQQKARELEEKVKNSRGYNREEYEKQLRDVENSLIDEILSLKILDPAMGSGHFLVEATDYIARALVGVLSGEVSPAEEKSALEVKETAPAYSLEADEEEDIRWARREVIERCIFGVDLNPLAVELAKLSLWLSTVAKDRPLSFLNHHLRCGNSLIGANIDDLASLPDLKKKKVADSFVQLGLFESIFKEKVNLLLGAFAQIELMPSDTVEQIRNKEKLYEDFRKIVSRFQDVADVWTGVYFGNEVGVMKYQNLQDNLRAIDGEWERLKEESWFKKAKEIAEEKRFFHWELEFPETFFEGNQRMENPGFDAVVGNPPYGLPFDTYSKQFLNKHFGASEYQLESFILFIEKALDLLKLEGFHSYISPTTWLSMYYFQKLRGLVLQNHRLLQVIFFKEPIFREATVETCIEIVKKQKPSKDSNIRLGVVSGEPERLDIRWIELAQSDVSKFEGGRLTEFLIPEVLRIYEKTKSVSFPLKNISLIVVGCKPYQKGKGNPPQTKKIVEERVFDADFQKDETYKPYLRGEDFHRYDLNSPKSRWIKFGEWLAEPRPAAPFFASEKIVIRQTADSLIATIDDEQYLNLNNVHNLALQTEHSLKFILALINSTFLSFMYRVIVPEFGRVFAEVKILNLEKLPIRQVSFVTSVGDRQKLLGEAKKLYESYLQFQARSEYLHFVSTLLEKKHKPASELVKKYNVDPLNKDWHISEGALWERSDVVHDILAYLAEQMIEMNKGKKTEIKGFLEWLEREITVKIDYLTNKTRIKAYHEHSFDDLLAVLKQNRGKLQIDPSHRNFQERLQREFDESLVKLGPLKERIEKTNWLIDQIVYKLYSLTEEEIRIVEENM